MPWNTMSGNKYRCRVLYVKCHRFRILLLATVNSLTLSLTTVDGSCVGKYAITSVELCKFVSDIVVVAVQTTNNRTRAYR